MPCFTSAAGLPEAPLAFPCAPHYFTNRYSIHANRHRTHAEVVVDIVDPTEEHRFLGRIRFALGRTEIT